MEKIFGSISAIPVTIMKKYNKSLQNLVAWNNSHLSFLQIYRSPRWFCQVDLVCWSWSGLILCLQSVAELAGAGRSQMIALTRMTWVYSMWSLILQNTSQGGCSWHGWCSGHGWLVSKHEQKQLSKRASEVCQASWDLGSKESCCHLYYIL